MNGPYIEIATSSDLAEILAIQKMAFLEEAAIYNCCCIPPLRQTLDDLLLEFEQKIFFTASWNGKTIGSVRAFKSTADSVMIEKLAVLPEMQNRGAATALLTAVEKHFPEVNRFELFTGRLSRKNLYLYNKLGYHEFKTCKAGDIDLVYLTKCRVIGHCP